MMNYFHRGLKSLTSLNLTISQYSIYHFELTARVITVLSWFIHVLMHSNSFQARA